MSHIFSIIDVGTNSILLLIARKQENKIYVLHRDAETSSLGKGMKNGLLTEEGIARAKIILEKYIQVSRKYMADKIIITGTSASREAKNISKLADWLKKMYDLPYYILSEEQELYYDYLANKHEFEDYKNLIIFDIGGGSTEFIIVEDSKMTYSASLKMGVRRLNNLFESDEDKYTFCKDVLSKSQIKQHLPSSFEVVGIGGTVTNLVAVKQGLKKWISEKVHKQVLALDDVRYFKDLWKKLSYEEIEMLIPFDPHRSDVLLSGTVLLENIFSYLGIKDIFVSDYGLQFGILKEAEKF
jgi:exopolyphosphatase/guanosine-5'-triphosphate,3'-diphosphate pyrophosphatase